MELDNARPIGRLSLNGDARRENEPGVAMEPGHYNDFTGYVNFNGTDGWAEHASFYLNSSFGWSILWHSGTWLGGTMRNAQWENGLWKDGTWLGETWKYGMWLGGSWQHGSWLGGLWENGEWLDGVWYDGTWHGGTWHDGRWINGAWRGGRWMTGEKGNGAVVSYPPSQWISEPPDAWA